MSAKFNWAKPNVKKKKDAHSPSISTTHARLLRKAINNRNFEAHPSANAINKYGSCLAERFFPEHFEDDFVKVLVSVVKSEFAFFQMKVKCVFCQPSKAHKTRLCEGPEAFNAINM